jgi:undecaprenyl-diphosphatase
MTRHGPHEGRAAASPAALVAAAVGGLGALAVAALAAPRYGRASAVDRAARRWMDARWVDRVPRLPRWAGGHESKRHRVAQVLGALAHEHATYGAGALAAAAAARRHGKRAAVPIALAAPLGNAAHGALKYTIRRPRPLAARLTGKRTPSFPSGHAARVAAAAGVVGYAAVRDGDATPAVAIPLGAAVAIAGAASRVYVHRHWMTDAVGGWGLGVTVAALCGLWYDRARRSP